MAIDEKPISSQMLSELYVQNLLNLIFTESKMIVTLMQQTNGAAERETKDVILDCANTIVNISCRCYDKLCNIYGRSATESS